MKLKTLLVSAVALLCSAGAWATDYTSSLPAQGSNWNIAPGSGGSYSANVTNDDSKNARGIIELKTWKVNEVYSASASELTFDAYTNVSVTAGTYLFRIGAWGRKQNVWGDDNEKTDENNIVVYADGDSEVTTAVSSATGQYYHVVVSMASAGTLRVGIKALSGNNANWVCWANPSLISLEPNSDFTSLITNPNITDVSNKATAPTGWVRFKNDNGGDSNYTAGKGDTKLQLWSTTSSNNFWGDIYQTIYSLPEGYYSLTSYVQDRDGDGADLYIYNSSTDEKKQVTITSTEQDKTTPLIYVENNGSINIGFEAINTNAAFITADNFRLTYYGSKWDTPIDWTSLIDNWDFTDCAGGWGVDTNFPGWIVSNPSSGNAWAKGATCVEYWIATATNGSFDYYQSVTGLPNGKYTLSASMWNSTNDEEGASVGGECGVYGTSTNGTVFAGVTDNCDNSNLHTYTTDGVLVTDGTLRVGVKNNTEMKARWFGVDWIKLAYNGNDVAFYAPTPTAFISATATTSGSWYSFTVPSTGRYKITSSAAVTLSYTQDGTTDADDGSFSPLVFAAVGDNCVTLSKGTLYFKGNADASITIAACTYDLDESSKTTSINDGDYFSSSALTTFTVSFSNATTDDTNASLAVIGTPVATLLKNGVSVATSSTLTSSGSTLTATFSDCNLTADANDYSISIPAGAFGYAGHVTNSAISVDFNTPVVFDGTYYLYNQDADRFLSRGSWWGTRAVADIYGTPVYLSTNAYNLTTVKSVDNNGYIKETGWLYTDGAANEATQFVIQTSTVEGYSGYRFLTNALGGTNYLYVNAEDLGNGSYGVAGNSVIEGGGANITHWKQTVWQLMSLSDHDTKVNAYPTANKSAVIEAAGISTTAGDFETYLSENYSPVDVSELIFQPSNGTSLGSGWTWSPTSRTNPGYPAYEEPYVSLYKNTGYYTYTISSSNLPAGIYKVKMAAFDRRKSASEEAALYAAYANIGVSYLMVNDQQVRIMSAEQMFDGFEGDKSNWSNQKARLNGGNADNTVYVYLDGSEDLDLRVEKPDYMEGSCMVFGNFTLTYYGTSLVDFNKEIINRNKGDITSLINGDFTDGDDGWSGGGRVSHLARSWSSSSVLNPFYETSSNGTLSCTLENMPAGTYKVVAASRAAAGCTITPQIAGTSGDVLTGVGDTRNENSPTSEINLNGVQMPYRDNTGFTTNANGHNWQWITATGILASDGNLVINFICNADGKTGSDSWMPIDDVHLYCTSLDATSYTQTLSTISNNTSVTNTGNASVVTCDIKMSNPNAIISSSAAINGAAGTQINNDLVSGTIANMVLYDGHDFTPPVGEYAATAAKLYRTITADKWSTLMLPFVPTTTFTAKMLPSKLDGEGVLFFEDATPANDSPILVKNESTLTEIIGARESAATDSKTAGADVPMQGVYARQGVPVSTGNHFYYIVGADDNELHKVTGDAVMISAFRAYFDLDDASYVKGNTIIMNFGDETCIKSMDKEQLTNDNAAIYNLAGQRISKPTKGINIINGKKVLVK